MRRESDLAAGLLLGAGLMYLLDPDRGRTRRALLRDQAVHAGHELQDGLDAATTDLRNRSGGMVAEAKSRLHREQPSDAVLEARVRSALGRAVSHAGAITVTASDGHVTLRGDVLADEMSSLRRAVASVRGVREVANHVESHEEAGDIPSLQGAGSRPQATGAAVLLERWPPSARLLAGVLGGVLALRGATGDSLLDPLLGLTGLALLARAGVNADLRRLTGMEESSRSTTAQQTAEAS